MRSYLKLKDWNTICDVCGFKFKASQLRKRWDGFMCCSSDWETRNPLDFIKIPRETIAPPWSRPEATDTFVGPGEIILTELETWLMSEVDDFILTEI